MSLNKYQRIVVAIAVPVVIFIFAISIASDIGTPIRTSIDRRPNPFDWENTGHIWLLSIVLITIFELFILRSRKNKKLG